MGKAYFWKTRFLLLESEIHVRYNFRIYKEGGEYIERLHIGAESFLKEILDTVDREEVYLRPEDVNFGPPPCLRSAKEVREESSITPEDLEKIFNAEVQF